MIDVLNERVDELILLVIGWFLLYAVVAISSGCERPRKGSK